MRKSCSNCTFMELKLLEVVLLVVNEEFKLYLYGIEMATTPSLTLPLLLRSNCTFMELKYRQYVLS